ncbi:hypothetical protein AB0N88_37020 [Streptomyces sp. NPDC093516]|uniref:hypothetical protein n=1 Tax=Streptomyces sp. NPDC093516 TaxID=3155304 RepID=UPI00342C80DD
MPVLDALPAGGADIEAPGAVIAGGTPLAGTRAFGQRRAARRLVDHGARTTLQDAATLGPPDRVRAYGESGEPPSSPARSGARAAAGTGPRRGTCATTASSSTGAATTA